MLLWVQALYRQDVYLSCVHASADKQSMYMAFVKCIVSCALEQHTRVIMLSSSYNVRATKGFMGNVVPASPCIMTPQGPARINHVSHSSPHTKKRCSHANPNHHNTRLHTRQLTCVCISLSRKLIRHSHHRQDARITEHTQHSTLSMALCCTHDKTCTPV